jgi:hypothetical protein
MYEPASELKVWLWSPVPYVNTVEKQSSSKLILSVLSWTYGHKHLHMHLSFVITKTNLWNLEFLEEKYILVTFALTIFSGLITLVEFE